MNRKESKTVWVLTRILIPLIAVLGLIWIFWGHDFFVQEETEEDSAFTYDYGVFLGVNAEESDRFADYETIVIDAEGYTAKEISKLKKVGHTVYSYINIGSLETWRSYYEQFFGDCLDVYENWEDEYWIDVSQTDWQKYLVETVGNSLKKKGIDGFFVDNCDVYYQYETEDIYDGVTAILQGLWDYELPVYINGGDVYVTKYLESGETLCFTGVNQECVFSTIKDYDANTFGKAAKEDRKYFTEYLETCKKQGLSVYLLEYTTDAALVKKIKSYCKKQGFGYYISETVDLT